MSFLHWPWERYTDQHGRPYYYNQAVRVSQWHPPQPLQPSACSPTEIGRSAPPLLPLSPLASRFVLRLTSAIRLPRCIAAVAHRNHPHCVRAEPYNLCWGMPWAPRD